MKLTYKIFKIITIISAAGIIAFPLFFIWLSKIHTFQGDDGTGQLQAFGALGIATYSLLLAIISFIIAGILGSLLRNRTQKRK